MRGEQRALLVVVSVVMFLFGVVVGTTAAVQHLRSRNAAPKTGLATRSDVSACTGAQPVPANAPKSAYKMQAAQCEEYEYEAGPYYPYLPPVKKPPLVAPPARIVGAD